jgi:hypothetical protein
MREDDVEAGREAIRQRAEELRTLERQGDLPAASKLLRSLYRYDAAEVGMGAGHTARWAGHPEFWKHMLAQVTKACANRSDGFALRAEEGLARNIAPVADAE